MNEPREILLAVEAAHFITHERDGLVRCHCGKQFENHSGLDGHWAHRTAAHLAALSEAGLTVCGERVGTQDRDGFLHELRQQVEGRPVFIESEEPK